MLSVVKKKGRHRFLCNTLFAIWSHHCCSHFLDDMVMAFKWCGWYNGRTLVLNFKTKTKEIERERERWISCRIWLFSNGHYITHCRLLSSNWINQPFLSFIHPFIHSFVHSFRGNEVKRNRKKRNWHIYELYAATDVRYYQLMMMIVYCIAIICSQFWFYFPLIILCDSTFTVASETLSSHACVCFSFSD